MENQQKFNPSDWLPNDDRKDVAGNVSTVVSRIESAHTDITGTYNDWLYLGFALSDELGESGRDYFHRISRFYPKYSYTECNKQYDNCLKSQGLGITIKTFFHLAKQAGIDITGAAVFNRTCNMGPETGDITGAAVFNRNSNQGPETGDVRQDERDTEQDAVKNRSSLSTDSVNLPTFPTSLYATLPDFLQKVVARCTTDEERDVMLLGALATISACLPNVYGIYGQTRVYANLFYT